MLKDNSMYQNKEEDAGAALDVNLVSKDMELNFSNKNEDDDELEAKPNGTLDNEDFNEV